MILFEGMLNRAHMEAHNSGNLCRSAGEISMEAIQRKATKCRREFLTSVSKNTDVCKYNFLVREEKGGELSSSEINTM